MGMFDSLLLKCPKCDTEDSIEFQSKSGGKMMNVFYENNLPVSVAVGMKNDVTRCRNCKAAFRLHVHIPTNAPVKLIYKSEKSLEREGIDPY